MGFPLALSPFEQYMVHDDRPDYSMNYFIRARFSGRIHIRSLERAAQRAARRHPLLASVVRSGEGSRWHWEQLQDLPRLVSVHPSSPSETLPTFPRVDLFRSNGVRLTVLRDAQRFDLIVQIHHACCDGMGALRFFEDLLIEYANERRDFRSPLPLAPLDGNRLFERGVYGLTSARKIREFQTRSPDVFREIIELHRTPCSPLVPFNGTPPDNRQQIVVAHHTRALTAIQSAAYVTAAKSQGTTLNNVLIRDVLVSLNHWRHMHEFGRANDVLRLSVPVNIREPQDIHVPATNVVGIVFLDCQSRQFQDPSRLLEFIHEALQPEARQAKSYAFLFGLECARSLAADGLMEITRPDQCYSSCLLTNLMRVFDKSVLSHPDGTLMTDDFVLDQFEAFPPLRPWTQATFGIGTYAGKTTISLRYDPAAITSEQARELIDTVQSNLTASPPSPTPVGDKSGLAPDRMLIDSR